MRFGLYSILSNRKIEMFVLRIFLLLKLSNSTELIFDSRSNTKRCQGLLHDKNVYSMIGRYDGCNDFLA